MSWWNIILILFFVYLIIPSRKDSSDKSFWNRSGLTIYTDNLTGLQYMKGGMLGGITPRLDENGRHIKELGR